MHNVVRDLFYSIFPNKEKYLTYKLGNSPIILSAPHGGDIKPTDIPYRTYGNRSRDTYTRRLIQGIDAGLVYKPYFIYADIHRSRVDLNRDIAEAAQGNPKAEKIWYDWNKFLSTSKSEVEKRFGRGLYIDIHSHNNSDKFQIGYGLKVIDYLDLRGGWEIKKHSTMYPLVRDGYTEKNLLFGTYSFPDSITSSGYKVLVPEKEEQYLNGGYNIHKYHGNGIGAIQIECPIPVLKNDLDGVIKALINAINSFERRFLL